MKIQLFCGGRSAHAQLCKRLRHAQPFKEVMQMAKKRAKKKAGKKKAAKKKARRK
jgi:hypothetical protein